MHEHLAAADALLNVSGGVMPEDHHRRARRLVLIDTDPALVPTRTIWMFLEYIRASRGEVTVCKEGYVRSRSGWFSERSANYLASGRAVVTQDTGWTELLPHGEGL